MPPPACAAAELAHQWQTTGARRCTEFSKVPDQACMPQIPLATNQPAMVHTRAQSVAHQIMPPATKGMDTTSGCWQKDGTLPPLKRCV